MGALDLSLPLSSSSFGLEGRLQCSGQRTLARMGVIERGGQDVRTAGPPDPQRPGGARRCVSPARYPPSEAAAGEGPPAVRDVQRSTRSTLNAQHSTIEPFPEVTNLKLDLSGLQTGYGGLQRAAEECKQAAEDCKRVAEDCNALRKSANGLRKTANGLRKTANGL